jgi:hypothetical protein
MSSIERRYRIGHNKLTVCQLRLVLFIASDDEERGRYLVEKHLPEETLIQYRLEVL